jgi:hypothetical protein
MFIFAENCGFIGFEYISQLGGDDFNVLKSLKRDVKDCGGYGDS